MDEKDFIQNRVSKDPAPLFVYLIVVLLTVAGIWWVRGWQHEYQTTQHALHPELQVTNRDMQLFLWQHPQHMRVHVRKKMGYLPAFATSGRGALDPEMAEQFVRVPPALLYRYHRWNNLIGKVVFPREEPKWDLFKEENPSWQVESDEAKLMQAYVGWINYYEEGEAINALPITYADVRALVAAYPGYAPEHWSDLEPNYTLDGEGVVPTGGLPSFVRVAIFNQQQ